MAVSRYIVFFKQTRSLNMYFVCGRLWCLFFCFASLALNTIKHFLYISMKTYVQYCILICLILLKNADFPDLKWSYWFKGFKKPLVLLQKRFRKHKLPYRWMGFQKFLETVWWSLRKIVTPVTFGNPVTWQLAVFRNYLGWNHRFLEKSVELASVFT